MVSSLILLRLIRTGVQSFPQKIRNGGPDRRPAGLELPRSQRDIPRDTTPSFSHTFTEVTRPRVPKLSSAVRLAAHAATNLGAWARLGFPGRPPFAVSR
ncbi:hypothetical protein CPAR01_06976 [Colletotrichum paranaense]|uniref:Uncharacterized protein n=1 Tax=Colletotrichum paranaense TaxID=1914294 RepID=A0ABQ9SNB1_9PEZI|nr:uncharacterized protein CPAR01_06976 [Colletotrichum paranaense]KAK1540987.1 hypothetical protein CPAR01_06976 [Colletotrichum paranaense]